MIHYSNRSVVNHGNDAEQILQEEQPQADSLCILKQLTKDNLLPVLYEWVEEYTAKRKGWNRHRLEEKMNHKVDYPVKFTILVGLGLIL